MSPVGSYETLMAAINSGANSVYFGIAQLNMRAKSSNNFTIDDLKKIITLCNEHNVKSYLTVNTVLYDRDLELMKQIIDTANEEGITAVIISDIAAMNYAKKQGVEVHASTQLNISNIEAVEFYSQFADVIVLARELTLRQIKQITDGIISKKITGPSGNLVQIEIFIHGALCMAISGKCYLSLHEQNASANRGACRQTCRKSYVVTEEETGYQLKIENEYIMSPKDLCTISFLDKILLAGVTVLKIEGRARPPEYVKLVTETYKQAISDIQNNTFSQEKIDKWTKELRTVFNRDFWGGYYLGKKLGEWNNIYGSKASKRKKYVGKITNYFSKIKVAEVLIQADTLEIGEEIAIIGPTTGIINATIKEIRKENNITKIAEKGDTISIPIQDKIRRSDKLYKLEKTDFFE